ncbi:DUF2254 domain-containing protein [Formosa algae]|uniref:Membrane protein n=1 Tax=Formosa algae TaxID=225843 RepID=A0A9X0YNE7_9FLAO|nr:DUF2254 domain-containing protein [Formosa algae]MBP1841123.1 putative membrane protein [Formosa algae]MDQ0336457.1 putative membrane protein [Formosa algae]OEI81418.1 hypothetical protein AST99_04060 [Formosa algae]
MKKIVFLLKKLKATFWFIPVLIILLAIGLSIGLVSLDQVINLPQDGLGRFFFVNSADSARSILSTISGAMIGVAGTVFSITLVALTLASSQFGPRLIRNFMYVRLNQVVLGSYVATYIYCLLILNAIKESDQYTFMPSLSILVAIIAACINILLLIVFIHQIATSIQADNVISDISIIISKQIKSLFPEHMGNELRYENTLNIDYIKSNYSEIKTITSPKNGYFQYIDNETLLTTVTEFNGLVELYFKPGDHLVEGIVLGKIYKKETIADDELEQITSQFVIGETKNAQQDLEFSIFQMVEIASRALSPGVNDPFTAITCIDNLTATLCKLAQVQFPSKYRMDEEKQLRIIAVTLKFEDLLDSSFNQIRQYSAGSTAVIVKLMDALLTINQFVNTEDYKNALLKHAKMVLNVGKTSLNEEQDLKLLIEKHKQITA